MTRGTVKISYFTGAKDNQPQSVTVDWDDLAESFRTASTAQCRLLDCRRSICAHKHGVAWSPAAYPENKTRGNANVDYVSCLVLDLDHLSPSELDSALLKLENYKLIVHASHSDRPDDRCLRVIIGLSRPVKAKEWPGFWESAVDLLGVRVDPSTSDCARIFFAPTRPADACNDAYDGSGYVYESQDGKVLDVDFVLTLCEEEEDAPSYSPTLTSFRGAPSEEAWETAVDALSGGWPDDRRHDCQRALAGALARLGWPAELVTDFVTEVCERAHPGNGDRNKRAKAAREAVEGLANGRNVWGWPAVLEFIDEEVVGIATNALRVTPQKDQNFVDKLSEAKARVDALGGDPGLVEITRDEIQSNLQGARKRLSRSTSPAKILEAKFIDRALKGQAFSDHPDEDRDLAFVRGLEIVLKYAGRGASNLAVAEFVTRSRPDIDVDTLCEMVAKARQANQRAENAELPLEEFEMDFRTGKPTTSSQHNFSVAMRKMGITFHYDAFARKKVIEYEVGDRVYRQVVADKHVTKLMFEIEQQFNFAPSKDRLFDYCGYRAHESEFHPVLNYLDGLNAWDGVPRLETWLIDFGGAEDTPYVRAVSRLLLIAAVRRVRKPGCKFDEMVILEAPQGSGKSTAIQNLCPNGEWFTDNFNLDGDAKKMIEQTSGKWIVEAGELRGMSARDHNAMKQYLSSTHDESRMAYAREAERFARQFIIIGTTNDTQYLRDHTGDRRYWPIRVQAFNVEGLGAIRDQLWAEASHVEATDVSIRLDPSLYEAAGSEQSKRRVDNPVKLKLEEYLGDKVGRIKVSDTWRLMTDDHVVPQNLSNQIGNSMQELGWQRVRITQDNKRAWFYARGNKEEMKRQLHVIGNLSFGFKVQFADELEIPALKN